MTKQMQKMLPLAVAVILLMVICMMPGEANAATYKKGKPVGIMATAVDQKVAITWEKVAGAKGYIVYEKVGKNGDFQRIAKITGTKYVRKGAARGTTYGYCVRSYGKQGTSTVKSKRSVVRYTTISKTAKSTVKNFLRTSLAPMGHTMYVWGGGWNKADTGAGTAARTVGQSSKWRAFCSTKKSSYNYRNYLYQIEDGLDCSGYVGWIMYNTMHTVNGSKGFVKGANKQGEWFASKGYGTWTKSSKVKTHKAGDIMSGPDHIWISLGQCSDGSTVVLHCSPAGVKLSGTWSKSGTRNSKAAKLADKYMKKYYPNWYKRYPSTTLSSNYNTGYGQFRWNTKTLTDPEGYRNMSADKVLADLFDER